MESGKVVFAQVVLPIPLGPNKKKVLFDGYLSILVYVTPYYTYFWSCHLQFAYLFNNRAYYRRFGTVIFYPLAST